MGDAAGRVYSDKRKPDFSDSDYKFALNIGISFQTPESFFLKSKLPIHCDLTGIKDKFFSISKYFSHPAVDETVFEATEAPEIVLLVAPGASGKSTLSCK